MWCFVNGFGLWWLVTTPTTWGMILVPTRGVNSKFANLEDNMKNWFKSCFVVFFICAFFPKCGTDKEDSDKNRTKILNSYANLIKMGYVDSGMARLKEHLIMFPESDEAHALLGQVYFKKGNDSLAMEEYNLAIKYNRNNKVAWLGLGVLLDKNEYYIKATDYYRKALTIDSGYYIALSNYVGNCLKNEKYEEAVQVGERALRMGGNKDSDMAILCYSYHMAGYHQQRDSLYRILLENNYQNIEHLERSIYSGNSEKDSSQ